MSRAPKQSWMIQFAGQASSGRVDRAAEQRMRGVPTLEKPTAAWGGHRILQETGWMDFLNHLINPDDNGTYVAHVPKIPGCHALGRTSSEAQSALVDVFAMIVEEYEEGRRNRGCGRADETQ